MSAGRAGVCGLRSGAQRCAEGSCGAGRSRWRPGAVLGRRLWPALLEQGAAPSEVPKPVSASAVPGREAADREAVGQHRGVGGCRAVRGAQGALRGGGCVIVVEMRAVGQCRGARGAGLWGCWRVGDSEVRAGGRPGCGQGCGGVRRWPVGQFWRESAWGSGEGMEVRAWGISSCGSDGGLGVTSGCGAVVGGCGMLQLGTVRGDGSTEGRENKGEAIGRCWCTEALVRGRGELWGSRSEVRAWLRSWVHGSEGNSSGAGVWGYGAAAHFFCL